MSSQRLRAGHWALCALVIGMLLSGTGFGQVADGNLVGNVLDSTGAGIPGAMVEVENMGTGVKNTTLADETGFYRFNNLLVGRYKVTGSLTGFTPATVSNVAVELSKTTTANITLAVGGVTAEVNVTESVALIDTTTPHISNSFTSQMIADLPAAANPGGGGIHNLALLGAGVASSGGIGVGTGPSVGGNRPRNNNFTIEGADNNRKDVTGPIVSVPVDAISEYTVLQNQFSAEFGHSSGGQFNTVIKSGTNEFHGNVYEYFQNRKLNAIDQASKRQFTPTPAQPTLTKPRFDQNTVGGSVGGPIIKNRLFFFGTYDYNPLGRASVPGAVTFAPTAAGYAMLESTPGVSRTNLDILKKYLAPSPAQTKTTPVTGTNGVTNNVPLGPLEIIGPNFENNFRWLGSVDFNQSERNQWRGRYIDNKTDTINTDANLPTFWVTRPITRKIITVSQFHTFGQSLVNELRASYTRYKADFPLPDGLSFPGLDVFPNVAIGSDLNLNLGPAGNSPQATVQNTYQLVENLGWVKEKHDLKFGADFRDLISSGTFIQRSRGDYGYNRLDRFVLDLPPDVIAQRNVGGKPYIGNNYSLYLYGNDNWKMTRNLTINLGLRWEYTTVPRSMKEFALNSIADVPGVLTFFEPKPQTANFAPRVGFAYTPGTQANTTIRGGFGINYDQIFDNVGTNARPPQATSTFDHPDVGGSNPGFFANGAIKPDAPTGTLTPAQARSLTSSWLPNQKVGYTINWNLGVQRSFARDYTVDIRYLGNRGVHLLFQRQLNRAAVVTADRNLPTFLTAPSQATIDSMTLTHAQLLALRNTPVGNTMLAAGFPLNITAYEPLGNSKYHGLATELNKRFANHLLFRGAYTWSHLTDDSTAEVASTTLTPRRPEDFFNISKEWASSALDRRHRFSFSWLYEVPWFAGDSNAWLRNVVGNWQFGGAYIAETGQLVTPQSVADSNLNGDAAADRVILNLAGDRNRSTDVTALCNSALLAGRVCGITTSSSAVVGYVANDPSAYYVRAQAGTLTTSGRNILGTPMINNVDFNVAKVISFAERYKVEIRADFYNGLNHPQYTAGRLSRADLQTGRNVVTTMLQPGHPDFAKFDRVWSSNPREIQLAAKFKF